MVTEIKHLHKFWFNYSGEDHYKALMSLMRDLKDFYNQPLGSNYKVKNLTDLKIGRLLVARYKEGDYHRVVVKELLPPNKVTLEYVDYGTKAKQ